MSSLAKGSNVSPWPIRPAGPCRRREAVAQVDHRPGYGGAAERRAQEADVGELVGGDLGADLAHRLGVELDLAAADDAPRIAADTRRVVRRQPLAAHRP